MPIVLLSLLRFFSELGKKTAKLLHLVPAFSIVLAFVFLYFIDFRHVLTSPVLRQYRESDLVSYENPWAFLESFSRAFANFLGILHFKIQGLSGYPLYRFAADLARLSLILISFLGVFLVLIRFTKTTVSARLKSLRSFVSGKRIRETYFVLELLALVALFLFGKIPLGVNRLNYFSIPLVLFFFLAGPSFLGQHQRGILRCSGIVAFFFLAVYASSYGLKVFSDEFRLRNVFFSQESYDNFGEAIKKTYQTGGILAMLENAAPPNYPLQRMIQTHPYYDRQKAFPIHVAISIEEILGSDEYKNGIPVVIVSSLTNSVIINLPPDRQAAHVHIPNYLYLSEYIPALMTSGWGTPRINRSVTGSSLQIGNRTYQRGIGTHAVSDIRYFAGGMFRFFKAEVGVDAQSPDDRGSVEFIVYGEGSLIWRSGIMKKSDGPRRARVNIAGYRIIRLQVSDAGDGIECDHADWAEAVFIK